MCVESDFQLFQEGSRKESTTEKVLNILLTVNIVFH